MAKKRNGPGRTTPSKAARDQAARDATPREDLAAGPAPRELPSDVSGPMTSALTPKHELDGIHGVEMTMDEIRARKKPTTFRQPICLDGDLADARDNARAKVLELERMVTISRMTGQAQDPLLVAQLKTAQAKAEEAEEAAAPITAVFVLRAIGRPAYAQLIREHPPTDDQDRDYREQRKRMGQPSEPLPYNPDTFPPSLIARSSQVPKLTESDADEIWNGRPAVVDAKTGEELEEAVPPWSEGECGALFEAALAANRIVR